jgi:multidrug resistance efflux pump
MPDLITDHEAMYYPGAAQDALRQARQTIADLRAALRQGEADLNAARAALRLTTEALEAIERHNPGGFLVGIAVTQGRRVLDK